MIALSIGASIRPAVPAGLVPIGHVARHDFILARWRVAALLSLCFLQRWGAEDSCSAGLPSHLRRFPLKYKTWLAPAESINPKRDRLVESHLSKNERWAARPSRRQHSLRRIFAYLQPSSYGHRTIRNDCETCDQLIELNPSGPSSLLQSRCKVRYLRDRIAKVNDGVSA